tara:strand:- start:101 stop:643 length:543 start_codon:yes stop_codon:yes gene_type:complete
MIRLTILSLLVGITFIANAQRKMDNQAYARFFSEAPLEDIEAINEKALGVLDFSNGKVAVAMNMKDFHFEKSLMEEHFNENYIESDKYPKATFAGEIANFKASDYENIADSLTQSVKGKLTIHGVTKDVTLPITFKKEGDMLVAKSEFIVKIEEYDVEVPTLLIKNIAEEVLVTTIFRLK